MKWSGIVLSISVCLVSATYACAQETEEDIYELRERIKRLERRIQKIEKGQSTPTAQDAKPTPGPMKNKGPAPVPFPRMPRTSGSSADSAFATSTGLSRTFNPAISVNGLFLGTYRSIENNNPNADVKTGLDIQEMEVQFNANVDTYLRPIFVSRLKITKWESKKVLSIYCCLIASH